MSTFAFEIISSFDERWHEVDVLLKHAEQEHIAKNISLYDAICRASVLLTVAQLEAFMKDVTKAVVHDFNIHSRFVDAPISMKRTFCRIFIDDTNGGSKENELRVQKLISVLDQLETKFMAESFLIEGEHEYRKNPTPDVIGRICLSFGIRNLFSWIESDRLGNVFSGTRSDLEELRVEMHTALESALEHFPYAIIPDKMNISEPTSDKKPARTMWQTFLDDLLKNRHDIAHGSVLINSLSLEDLRDWRIKLTIMEYAIMAVVCYKVCTK